MTPEQFRRVRELFERALENRPTDLSRWLDEQAADNPEVRAEVHTLLDIGSRAGSFLSEPVAARVGGLLEETGALEPGTNVGPYTIEREIGRGGMGHVYRARDARLGRIVALKALPPRLTGDEAQRERLRREARAAAALAHPGICTVYALEELDGQIYIASELVVGHTLREEITRAKRPTAAEVQQTARELADALASAHAAGITHRDLKPENIMRGDDGRLKILDFGLARFEQPADETGFGYVTQPGMLVGTPAYMAPEQLNGRGADARSDVFAFGVVIYEYACGVHPFTANTAIGVVARVLESEVAPISERCPSLPPQLVAVIERCLRKAPGDRFSSAAEIVSALDRDPAGVPSSAVAVWWRRHQLSVIALYLLASVVAWLAKEWQPGWADAMFPIVGIAATSAAIFRGHLMFTERMNRRGFDAARRRAWPVTLALDAVIALALAVDGLAVYRAQPLAAVLTIALAVGIGLVSAVVEPATTQAAFGEERGGKP